MADASRDSNRVTTLLGVNDVTGAVQPINVNSSGEILVSMTGGGSGDVVGPASATDNAVVRFDGTTGTLVQNSTVLIGDTGAITGVLSVTGVAGGSSVTGGTGASDALTLRSTSNATKGLVAINDQGGNVTIGGGATASELRFLEPSGSGTNYSAFVATAQAANITYTLPAAVGAAGTFLKDAAGDGVLSWAAPAGGGDVVGPAGATDNAIVRFDGATGTLIQNSAVTIADTTGVTTGMVFPNTGLNVQDTNASHNLNIKPGSDLTADRIFTITTGDAARTLSMAGNVTTAADFITSGANSLTLTTTGATNVTLPLSGTLVNDAVTALTSLASVGTVTTGVWNATDVPVSAGGTGLSTISALSVWVANSANTITEVTPGAGNSVRVNGAGTAWEAFTPSASVPTAITVANEATDTTCFVSFFTAATGDLGPKSNAGLTFDSSTGMLTATGLTGPLTGNVTGNCSGTAATVTGAAQAAITSLGTLTTLTVDDITINGNTISSAGASTLAITPTAGQAITFDGTITLDAGVVAGATSITSTTFVGALTGTASGNLVSGGALGTPSSGTLTNATGLPAAAIVPGTLATGTYLLAENASIGLDPAGSADGKFTGITVTGTAGYAQAFADLVYLDPTDSRWEAVDANAASGADGDARGMLGMVVVAGTDGASCTILLNGIIRADAKFPAFTVNNPVYASETAAAVTQTQPTTTDVVIRIVGSALTADEMYFNPDWAYITHV